MSMHYSRDIVMKDVYWKYVSLQLGFLKIEYSTWLGFWESTGKMHPLQRCLAKVYAYIFVPLFT